MNGKEVVIIRPNEVVTGQPLLIQDCNMYERHKDVLKRMIAELEISDVFKDNIVVFKEMASHEIIVYISEEINDFQRDAFQANFQYSKDFHYAGYAQDSELHLTFPIEDLNSNFNAYMEILSIINERCMENATTRNK